MPSFDRDAYITENHEERIRELESALQTQAQHSVHIQFLSENMKDRFDRMETRLDEAEVKRASDMGSVISGLEKINSKLEEGAKRFDAHQQAIAKLEAAEAERKEFKRKAWGVAWKVAVPVIVSIAGLFNKQLAAIIEAAFK